MFEKLKTWNEQDDELMLNTVFELITIEEQSSTSTDAAEGLINFEYSKDITKKLD